MSYESTVLEDSPVLYWKLDEKEGTSATDSSGKGFTGTYKGSPTLKETSALPNGEGTAVKFARASSQQVSKSDNAELRGMSALTVEMWVKLSSAPTSGQFFTMLYKGPSSGKFPYDFDYRNEGGTLKVALALESSTKLKEALWTQTLSTSAWTHIVATYDGTNHRLYINGKAHASNPITGGVGTLYNSETNALYLASFHEVDYFNGLIDEVAVYRTALSAARVEAHFKAAEASGGPVEIPLATAAGTSSTTLALSAATQIPLSMAAGAASTSVALSAPTQIPLGSAAGIASTASLSLTAPTQVPLASAAGGASTSLGLTVPTQLPLSPAVGTTSTALSLSAPTQIPLSSSAATSSTSLMLTAPTQVPLGPSVGTGATSLSLTSGSVLVPLGPAAGMSATSLGLNVPTRVVLAAATGTASTSINISTPAGPLPNINRPSGLALWSPDMAIAINLGASVVVHGGEASVSVYAADASARLQENSTVAVLADSSGSLDLLDPNGDLILDG